MALKSSAGVHKVPMEITMENARAEAESVIFTCVERVLQEHNISPHQVAARHCQPSNVLLP